MGKDTIMIQTKHIDVYSAKPPTQASELTCMFETYPIINAVLRLNATFSGWVYTYQPRSFTTLVTTTRGPMAYQSILGQQHPRHHAYAGLACFGFLKHGCTT